MGTFPSFMKSKMTEIPKNSLFEYSAKSLTGNKVNLNIYKGHKSLMVVNVASKCGYTNQYYKELVAMRKELHESLGENSFEVLGFPCNQFNSQEFPTPEAILDFVKKFDVQFPLFEVSDVNGDKTNKIFQFLKFNSPTLHKTVDGKVVLLPIGWNFGKFLIDAEGHVVKYYGPATNPEKTMDDIKKVISGELKGTLNKAEGSISLGLHETNQQQA